MIQNDDMHESIDSLKDLVVGKMESLYEYTKKNIAFALSLMPDDMNLKLRRELKRFSSPQPHPTH